MILFSEDLRLISAIVWPTIKALERFEKVLEDSTNAEVPLVATTNLIGHVITS